MPSNSPSDGGETQRHRSDAGRFHMWAVIGHLPTGHGVNTCPLNSSRYASASVCC